MKCFEDFKFPANLNGNYTSTSFKNNVVFYSFFLGSPKLSLSSDYSCVNNVYRLVLDASLGLL